MKWKGITFTLLLLPALLLAQEPQAENRPKRKEMNFEGDLVEGASRQPLDSLTQTSGLGRKGSKSHLYEKKEEVREISSERVEEILGSF